MITAETLRALLAEVEEAKAGSRELDAGVWYALVEKPRPGDKLDRDIIGKWPAYTTSIDAALALVAKGLPASTMWLLESGGDGDHGCTLVFDDGPDVCSDWHVGPPSLAILVALLRAPLQQSETAHVER